jgi:hypothetical protein
MDLSNDVFEDRAQGFSGAVLQSAALYSVLSWFAVLSVCFVVKNFVF